MTTQTPTNDEQSELDDEAKKWQRRADQERERARRYQRDALTGDATRAEVAVLQKSIFDLIDAFKQGADDEDIETVRTNATARSAMVAERSQWQEKLDDMLFNSDTSWDDDQYNAARDLWDEGEYADSYKEALRIINGSTEGSDEAQESIQDAVAAVLAKLGANVDTSTSTAPRTKRYTVGDARDLAAEVVRNPKGTMGQVEDVMAQYFKPRT